MEQCCIANVARPATNWTAHILL